MNARQAFCRELQGNVWRQVYRSTHRKDLRNAPGVGPPDTAALAKVAGACYPDTNGMEDSLSTMTRRRE
jgi:hypothetical protein